MADYESCNKPVFAEKYTIIDLSPSSYMTVPWPSIIIAILGLAFILYTLIVRNISNNLRIFAFIMIFLWSVIWIIILWVLWRDQKYNMAWGILLVPTISLTIFFIFVVVMNITQF